ncbi:MULTISPECIES: YihY/virulence factor BrkB family protein [Pedobacter]|uniref:Ribonuclease BN n=1 Tax=Pedobacter heparinus (strain ATCC 13125 / DSM 2366 / CIP 104194 / JCM 7457 / NBRC 12017 / NCIMB 9290 / NRRL B-14731 / HIM 762-3) TaxID=485917 RepID=C6XSV3_PEDHD|nr:MULTISPECIES: YihY/virulence factor BrkB family protein [Pedobacter]ACU05666.1 ribonuclease BN [Pedobacter heparinus DSM 2366]MBB5440832.1 membrane protein [Pedobacter sp. AK017]
MKFIKKIIHFFKAVAHLFIAAGKGFIDDRVMKLSAALAYYTIFSLTPLIIIIISATSLFLGDNMDPNTKLFGEISELVGADAANQLRSFVNNANYSGKSTFGLIIGITTLVIGASAIFVEIQDSINLIWKVKAVPKEGWKKLLINRLLSFSLIASLGFLLLVSLVVNSIVVGLGHKIASYIQIEQVSELMMLVVTNVLTLLVVTTIFAIIFKVLPDVIIKWKPAIIGALFTAILFSLGKYLIGIYIEVGNPGSAFGAAGSIIVILLWIYYTAIILYFGAEFTQAYAEKYGKGIMPSKYAVHTKIVVVEKKVDVLPAQHPEDTKI